MSFLKSLFLFSCLFCASLQAPPNLEGLLDESLGVIPSPGIENCGSSGRVVRVEATGCTTNPCFFAPSQSVRLDFTIENPDASITLSFRGFYSDLVGTKVDFWDYRHPGVVMPGEIITLTNTTIIPPSLSAGRGFITLQIWDSSFGHSTACGKFETLISL